MKARIFDSKGEELNLGDLVVIQREGRSGTLSFFARIQLINGTISPIRYFAFDRIVKIDSLPDNCNHVKEDEYGRPEYWTNFDYELIDIDKKTMDDWRSSVIAYSNINGFIRFEK